MVESSANVDKKRIQQVSYANRDTENIAALYANVDTKNPSTKTENSI